jgi:hypothetical protein
MAADPKLIGAIIASTLEPERLFSVATRADAEVLASKIMHPDDIGAVRDAAVDAIYEAAMILTAKRLAAP